MKGPANSWTTSQRAPTNQRTNESELEQELEVGGECASGEGHGYISYIASTANLYPRLSDSVPDIAETALGERSVDIIQRACSKSKVAREKESPSSSKYFSGGALPNVVMEALCRGHWPEVFRWNIR